MGARSLSYQGQELDNEIKGEGNSVNYKYRMHYSRVGRFFVEDPLAGKYPELTPYQFSSNSPIYMSEIEGLEGAVSITFISENANSTHIIDGENGNDFITNGQFGEIAGGLLLDLGLNPDDYDNDEMLNIYYDVDKQELIKTTTTKISTVTGTKIETGDRDPRGWYYNIPKGSMDMEGNGPFSSVEIGCQGVVKASTGRYVKIGAKLKDTGTTQGTTSFSKGVNINPLNPYSVKYSGSVTAYIKFNIHENSNGFNIKNKVPIYKFGSFFIIFDSKGVQSFGFDIGLYTSSNKPSTNISKEVR